MAKQIEFRPIARPAEEEVQRRLDNAPKEHAEAILNAYRMLQTLHDTQTLDVVRGLLGAGGTVLNEGVSVITAPASVRSIRNLLVLLELVGQLDPEVLKAVVAGITPALQPVGNREQPAPPPPSLWTIMKSVFTVDVRRGLAFTMTLLGALGRGLAGGDTRKHA